MLGTYYNMVIGWALIYFWESWSRRLPWTGRASEYWFQDVLNQTPRIDGEFTGSNELQPHLVLALFCIWACTFVCLVRGIHSAGKIAYFMVLFPVILMIILLCCSITLPGASTGIAYYLTPRMEFLFTFDVWVAACGQILFSLSPGTGAAISLSSYNSRENKMLLTDSLMIAASNSAFSILSGFVVFSVLGHTAHVVGRDIHDIAVSGPGLAFVLFADAFASMWGGNVLSVLFFFMLILLGLDSSFAWVQTLQTYIFDAILCRRPDLNVEGKGISKRCAALSLTFICVILFLMGLPFTTRRGMYYLEVIDHFCPTYCLLITVFFEYILLGYHVGPDQFNEIISSTRGESFSFFWQRVVALQIRYIGPSLLCILFVFTVISEGSVGSSLKVNHEGYYVYGGFPTVLIITGWLTVIIPVLIFTYYIVKVDLKRLWGRIMWPAAARLWRRHASNDASTKLRAPVVGYPHMVDVIGQSDST